MTSKTIRRISLILLTVILSLSIIGCAADDTPPPVNEDNGNGNGSQVEDEKIVITDHLGREVVFDEPAETIVSGYFITSSMMIALGLTDKVVGVESNPQSRDIYHLAAPQYMDLPTVGTLREFDLEAAVALEPDVVVVSVRIKEAVESMEDLGLKVIAVNPESAEELHEALLMIGKATGHEDRAQKLIDYHNEKTTELKDLLVDKERKNVYLGGNSDFLSTASNKMYQHTLIETAGGNNVAGDIDDTYWAEISYEQLIAYNPDVIVGIPGAAYTKEDILNDERLQGVKAVENGHVYFMPSDFESWDSPIPSAILGTMWLTSVLHEDVYAFEDFKDEAFEFYKDFYNIEIDKDKITK